MEPDDVVSESDLEIVHGDGTVTDKLDGMRRPYSEHVARIGGLQAGIAAGRQVEREAGRRRRWWYAAAFAGGAAVPLAIEAARRLG